MKRNRIYEKASEELGIPVETIKLVYSFFWRFIRTTIEEQALKDADENTFQEMRTSFNIPSIGKLCCTPGRFKALKENYRLKQKINERNKIEEASYSHSEQDPHNSKKI